MSIFKLGERKKIIVWLTWLITRTQQINVTHYVAYSYYLPTVNANVNIAMCKPAAKCLYVIHTLKSNLLNFAQEHICSWTYLDTKIGNIFFLKFLNLQHLESQNWTSLLALYHSERSTSSAWRLPGALSTSKENGQVNSWISFPTFNKSLSHLQNSSCSFLKNVTAFIKLH